MNFFKKLNPVSAVTEAFTSAVKVFKPDATAGQAQRHERALAADQQANARVIGAQSQFGKEFRDRKGNIVTDFIDAVIDAINRLPRPMFAVGTFALFLQAFTHPLRFAESMEAMALVPQELWWMCGGVVTFYFGGRFFEKRSAKAHEVAAKKSAMDAITAREHRKATEAKEKVRAVEPPATHITPGVADAKAPDIAMNEHIGNAAATQVLREELETAA